MNLDTQNVASAHEEALERLRADAIRVITNSEKVAADTKETLRSIELQLHDLRLARTPDDELPFEPDDLDD